MAWNAMQPLKIAVDIENFHNKLDRKRNNKVICTDDPILVSICVGGCVFPFIYIDSHRLKNTEE